MKDMITGHESSAPLTFPKPIQADHAIALHSLLAPKLGKPLHLPRRESTAARGVRMRPGLLAATVDGAAGEAEEENGGDAEEEEEEGGYEGHD